MSQAQFVIPPVCKTITFEGPPDVAFDRFVNGIGSWWPLATHSVGGEKAVSVSFEPAVKGGVLAERWADGETRIWGRITEFHPPERLSFTWHVQNSEDQAQLIELLFTAASGRTVVELVHSGWERLGDAGAAMRENYDHGWNVVLEHYLRAA